MDNEGNVCLCGITRSTSFPVTADALQSLHGGDVDGFVAILNWEFSELLFASYIGGSGEDQSRCVWGDNNGNICSSGQTKSVDFPILNAFQSEPADKTNRADSCLLSFIKKLPYGIDEGNYEFDIKGDEIIIPGKSGNYSIFDYTGRKLKEANLLTESTCTI